MAPFSHPVSPLPSGLTHSSIGYHSHLKVRSRVEGQHRMSLWRTVGGLSQADMTSARWAQHILLGSREQVLTVLGTHPIQPSTPTQLGPCKQGSS